MSNALKFSDLSHQDKKEIVAANENTQARNWQIISTTAGAISRMLDEICEYGTGRECTAKQFYSRAFYIWHVAGVTGLIIIMMVLINML